MGKVKFKHLRTRIKKMAPSNPYKWRSWIMQKNRKQWCQNDGSAKEIMGPDLDLSSAPRTWAPEEPRILFHQFYRSKLCPGLNSLHQLFNAAWSANMSLRKPVVFAVYLVSKAWQTICQPSKLRAQAQKSNCLQNKNDSVSFQSLVFFDHECRPCWSWFRPGLWNLPTRGARWEGSQCEINESVNKKTPNAG